MWECPYVPFAFSNWNFLLLRPLQPPPKLLCKRRVFCCASFENKNQANRIITLGVIEVLVRIVRGRVNRSLHFLEIWSIIFLTLRWVTVLNLAVWNLVLIFINKCMFLDIIIIFLLFQHTIYLLWTQRPKLKVIRDDDW